MRTITYILVILALLLSGSTIASEKSDSDIIFKAMEDEMARNMTELKLDDNGTPFYIAYNLMKAKRGKILATMGAIIESNSDNRAWCSVNLKMGDYNLNDEKYYDKVNQINHNDGSFSVPLEVDYDGIRRSLWIMSSNVYKNASEKYKNKKEQMERQGISVEDLPSPDFSKEDVNVVMQDELEDEFSKEKFEHLTKELSAQFKSFKDVIESEVELNFQNVMQYSVNSEGIKFKTPYRFYILSVNATMLDKNNHTFSQSLEYYQTTFKKLPSGAEISKDINLLVENMHLCKESKMFTDVYSGPVLFMKDAGVELCYKQVFDKGMGLVANPRNLVYNKEKGLVRAEHKSWEDYKDKKVVDLKLTFELKPLMSDYKGDNLLGSFQLDLDGLIPQETELLVKNGILNQQLVGRTPTALQHKSLRHNRFYIHNNGFSQKVAPSVIKVTASEVKNTEEIRSDMVELAEEEGLDYVFIVKPLECGANKAPINYYKVNVIDGSEEIVSGVSFKYGDRTLMKVQALGDGECVINSLLPDYAGIENKMNRYKNAPSEILEMIRKQMVGIQGTPISVICPDALLLESVELNGVKNSIQSASRVVSNPMDIE